MPKSMRGVGASLVLAVVAALVMSCGGSSEKVDITVNLRAENNRFVPDRIEVPAGKTVKLNLQNLDVGEHDLEIAGLAPSVKSGGGHGGMEMDKNTAKDALTVHSQGKKTASVTFVAERAGTYEFICTMQGHKEVGMVGKLVVTDGKPAAVGAPLVSPMAPPTQSPSPAVPASMPQVQLPAGHGGH